MGRKKTHPVESYFVYDSVLKKSTCKICKTVLARNQSSNQEKHIERLHKNEFKKLEQLKAKAPKQLSHFKKNPAKKRRLVDSETSGDSYDDSSDECETETSSSKQPTIDKFIKPKNLSVNISLTDIRSACLEMITVNGRPFVSLEDSGFQKIIKPLMAAVNNNNAINSQNIKKMIIPLCESLRKQIKEEVKGKMISIKVDAATRLNRAFLGINIQYMMEDTICLRTLACRELYESHTGAYLKEVILEVLEEYGISILQIYTFTSDNGANIIKCVDLLREDVNLSNNLMNEVFGDVDEDDSEALMAGLFEAFKLLETENMSMPSNREILNGVRCGAHTLQLAVFDVIKKDAQIEKTLTTARAVSKKLRTSNMTLVLKARNLKLPILDVPTRWNSSYNMLDRLIELKEFCKEMEDTTDDVKIRENTWDSMKSLCASLKPLSIATVKMQAERLTFSEFYGIWIMCRKSLEDMNTRVSKLFLAAILKRQDKITSNVVLLSCVYLDPRFNFLLSDSEIYKAKRHLSVLFTHNSSLNKTNKDKDSDIIIEEIDVQEICSEISDLEKMLQTEANKKRTIHENKNVDIMTKLNEFEVLHLTGERLHSSEDILKFFKDRKKQMPEMYILGNIVLAVPATQVSVERLFSNLAFIFNPLRSALGSDLLEATLIIRSNFKFAETILKKQKLN